MIKKGYYLGEISFSSGFVCSPCSNELNGHLCRAGWLQLSCFSPQFTICFLDKIFVTFVGECGRLPGFHHATYVHEVSETVEFAVPHAVTIMQAGLYWDSVFPIKFLETCKVYLEPALSFWLRAVGPPIVRPLNRSLLVRYNDLFSVCLPAIIYPLSPRSHLRQHILLANHFLLLFT